MNELTKIVSSLKKRPGLFITVGTGIGYMWNVIYQTAFINQFGISSEVINLKLDAQSVLNVALLSVIAMIALIFVMWLGVKMSELMSGRWPIPTMIFDGILFMLSLVILYSYLNENTVEWSKTLIQVIEKKHDRIGLILPSVIMIIYVLAKIIRTIILVLRKKYSFMDAYVDVSRGIEQVGAKRKLPTKKAFKDKPRASATRLILQITLILLLLFGAPIGVAQVMADNKRSFQYVVGSEESKSVGLIIANSADGYIVVEYNKMIKKFSKQYKVINIDNVIVGTTEVEPISGQK